MGHEIVEVYADQGISGANGRDKRPAFDRLHLDATRRRFDLVMAWSVDRLGRSLQDLCGFLSELHALRIDLFLHQQGLDTTTPAGKAMFQMLGVFAQFERSIIRERVLSSMARAKVQGTKSGKPIGRPSIPARTRDAIRAEHGKGGVSLRTVARRHHVGVETVRRCWAEIEQRRL